MILKASQRSGGANLAVHLMNDRDNEHVLVHDLRGFVADDLRGAFKEAEAINPNRSMLGLEQEAWLYSWFKTSQARWNILGQNLLAASLRQSGRDKDKNPIIGHYTDGWTAIS